MLAFFLKSVIVETAVKERHVEAAGGLQRVVSLVRATGARGFPQLFSRDRMEKE